MATIANWNGHTFEVSPNLIRGFTDLTIEGGCETTTKNSSKQKYEERKYGESPTISMTAHLNAQLGVTDVRAEAMEFVQEATEGACAYFYLGTAKLFPAKLILTKASINQIVHMPLSGDTWISCDVKLTFKQGTKNDGSSGSSSSSGGSSSKKKSVKRSTGSTASPTPLIGPATKGLNALIAQAKSNSKETVKAGLSYQAARLEVKTTKTSSSAKKTSATTGRTMSTAGLIKAKDRI